MEPTPEQPIAQGGSAGVMVIKRPAFQFYPADWRKDAALQSCSIAAQGLWINMMCIAHQCDPYGHLTINKKPMNGAQIGRLVGLSAKECDKLIAELEGAGVVSRTDEGALFSRRMVRDECVRNKRGNGGEGGKEYGALGAEHGKKGGRPPKTRGVIYPPSEPQNSGGRGVIYPPLEPPPSSSSSSSSSNTTHTAPDPSPGGTDVPVCVLICQKMQEVGVKDANASDKVLGVLVEKGADAGMFVDAAAVALGQGKGFAYALGIVKNKMTAAAALGGAALAVPAALGADPALVEGSVAWLKVMAERLGVAPCGPLEQVAMWADRVRAAVAAHQAGVAV